MNRATSRIQKSNAGKIYAVGKPTGPSPYRGKPHQMSDREWAKIQKHSNLPDEARAEVQAVIDEGREGEWRAPPSAAAKRNVKATVKAIEKAVKMLDALSKNELALAYIFESEPKQLALNAPWLEYESNRDAVMELAESLKRFSERCSESLSNFPPRPSLTPADPDPLIDTLNHIVFTYLRRNLSKGLKATGVTDGDLEWVDDVISLIDIKVGRGQTRSALERVIRLKLKTAGRESL